jgi:hypothetical protein
MPSNVGNEVVRMNLHSVIRSGIIASAMVASDVLTHIAVIAGSG